MTYTLALRRLDPFGKGDLGACFACTEGITWEDDKLVEVALRENLCVPFHGECFEHFRAGLNLFAELVLYGAKPAVPN